MNEHVMKLCFDIKGQTAMVTGASSSLGVTSAETLAELGFNLFPQPLDLKAALVYLASPASNYVTGQTIFVDGGWTAL